MTAGTGRPVLAGLVEAAAPPRDRADRDLFVPAGDGAAEAARWLRLAGGADPELRPLLLAYRDGRLGGVTGFAPVRLRDPDRLPAWARPLPVLLATAGRSAAVPATELVPALREQLVRYGRKLLDDLLVAAGCRLVVEPAARDGLARQLAGRLFTALGPALDFELSLGAGPVDLGEPGWLARFRTLPALPYAVGTVVAQWEAATAELLTRLAADADRLAALLPAGADPRRLVDVRGDAGDVHEGGRSVALLALAGGSVVYKPKDLRVGAAFLDLLRWAADRGLPLPARWLLPRGAYAWEEYVPPAPCDDPAGPQRYYRRAGMLVRLVQLLGGRDFWADNLHAHGEHPVLLDLEMLLQPWPAPAPDGKDPDGRDAAGDLLRASVLPTGLVTMTALRAAGCTAADFAALASPGARPMPARDSSQWLRGDPAAPPGRDGWLLYDGSAAAPEHAGRRVPAGEHHDAIEAGYRQAQAWLADHRAELLGPGSPLAAFAGPPVRYIWRSTWDYQAIQVASVGPAALASATAREAMLARLLHTALPLPAAQRPAAAALVAAEIDALRELDIPLLRTDPTGTEIHTAAGERVAGLLDRPSFPRVATQLAPDWPTGRHVGLLRAGLRLAVGLPADPAVAPVPSRAGPLREAERIGEALLAARDGDGWLGLVRYPAHGLAVVEPLPPDLLSGTLGLAVFLAELARLVDDRRAAAAATALARAGLAGWPGGRRTGGLPRFAGRRHHPGGFTGAGAALYAAARVSAALGDTALAAELAGWVGELAVATEPTPPGSGGADLVSGEAGLVLALSAAVERGALPATVAARLVDPLWARCTAPDPAAPDPTAPDSTAPGRSGYPPPATPDGDLAALLPPAGWGVALARRRLGRWHPVPLHPADPPPDPPPDPPGGVLLARLERARLDRAEGSSGRADPTLPADLAAALDRPPADAAQWRHHAELALAGAAAGLSADPGLLTTRVPAAVHPRPADLSAVTGLAGTGLALLRLHDPTVRSLRLLH